jgi:hypothetical protein
MKKLTLVSLIIFTLAGCKVERSISYPGGSKLYYNIWSSEKEAVFLGKRLEMLGYFDTGRNYKVEYINFPTGKFEFSTKITPEEVPYIQDMKYDIAVKVRELRNLLKKTDETVIWLTFNFINSKTNKTELRVTGDDRPFAGDDVIQRNEKRLKEVQKNYWNDSDK